MSTKLTPTVQSAITNVVEPAVANTPAPVESNVTVSDVVSDGDEGDSLEGFWGGEVKLEGLEALPEGQSNYKGLKPLKEYVNYLPVEVKKQLHNMQADYTRKTQELAEARRQLEQERASVNQGRDQITKAMEHIQSQIGEEISEDEIYNSTDGLKKFIYQQSLKNQAEIYKPVYEQMQAEKQAAENKRIEEQARSFVASKPEFKDPAFKSEVAKLIKEQGMQLQHAYAVVKEQMAEQQPTLEDTINQSNKRSRQKDILTKISGGSKKSLPPLDVKGLPAAQKLKAIADYKERYGHLPPRG